MVYSLIITNSDITIYIKDDGCAFSNIRPRLWDRGTVNSNWDIQCSRIIMNSDITIYGLLRLNIFPAVAKVVQSYTGCINSLDVPIFSYYPNSIYYYNWPSPDWIQINTAYTDTLDILRFCPSYRLIYCGRRRYVHYIQWTWFNLELSFSNYQAPSLPYLMRLYFTKCPVSSRGGIRGTVVTRWTAGQQVERSILHQGHDS